MAGLASAKKGDRVTLKSGKVVISDGRGGGSVDRPSKRKPAPKKQKVKPSKPTKNKGTVARGLSAAFGQGKRLTDLVKQGKGN